MTRLGAMISPVIWLLIGGLALVLPGCSAPPTLPTPSAERTPVPTSPAAELPFPARTVAEAARVRPTDHVKGATTDPAVVLIEYADFQCPGCAVFADLMDRLVTEYPNHVQLVYRHFPLNAIHPHAQKAAEAAEAAGAQGAFWPYHRALFARQRDLAGVSAEQARAVLLQLAAEVGLDAERFAAELDGGQYAETVRKFEQEAVALGLPGTPSLIVNGEPVVGAQLPFQLEAWRQYVQSVIAARAP